MCILRLYVTFLVDKREYGPPKIFIPELFASPNIFVDVEYKS